MTLARVLVSACLLGARVRYDGGAKTSGSAILRRWVEEGRVISVCPEVEGGLPVPRPPAELQGGTGAEVLSGLARLRTRAGADVTEAFVSGANRALALVREHGLRVAILKARSPSCGSGRVCDGTFSNTLRDGDGVTAALLASQGVAVFTEAELEAADLALGR